MFSHDNMVVSLTGSTVITKKCCLYSVVYLSSAIIVIDLTRNSHKILNLPHLTTVNSCKTIAVLDLLSECYYVVQTKDRGGWLPTAAVHLF